MQTTERYEDWNNVLRDSFRRLQSRIWTALPVIVLEDSDGFTVSVVSALKYRETDEFGNVEDKDISKFIDVPVCWPQGGGSTSGGSGYALTFPIKKDDEGIVVFSSRCIDSWWELGKKKSDSSQSQTQQRTKGTPQPQTDIGQPLIHTRMHNLSDAMFIPGVRSKPRKMNPVPSTTTAQFRTDNQHFYCEISQDHAKLVYASDKQQLGQTQQGQTQQKETQPRMVVDVYSDKIRGAVLDENGSETAFFELTSAGAFNGKAPQGVTWDAPFIRCTGEVIGQYTGANIHLTTHVHSQPNDSHGDAEADTYKPKSGS